MKAFVAFEIEYNHVLSADNVRLPPRCAPRRGICGASGLVKTLASKTRNVPRSCSSTVQFANGPKRSMGQVLGAKKSYFLIRGAEADEAQGGRAGGTLSIRGPERSLGPLRVVTIHG